jgi:hypothetical protein
MGFPNKPSGQNCARFGLEDEILSFPAKKSEQRVQFSDYLAECGHPDRSGLACTTGQGDFSERAVKSRLLRPGRPRSANVLAEG